MTLNHLSRCNPELRFYSLENSTFARYGKILSHISAEVICKVLNEKPIPAKGNIYIANDAELQMLAESRVLALECFGGQPIAFGYCNGNSDRLNALEWHECPEVCVAATDLVLLLGLASDIRNGIYDAEQLEAFFVPANSVFQLHSRVLHFAPCKTQDEGFRCGIALTANTNQDFSDEELLEKQDPLLFKRNKWILAHPENTDLIERGASVGICGSNYQIVYKSETRKDEVL